VGVTSNPIGRFGNEQLGSIVGPGTVNWSSGLRKRMELTENLHLMMEGTFTDVLNHINLNDPVLDITSASFGKITTSRGSDFGGTDHGIGQRHLQTDPRRLSFRRRGRLNFLQDALHG
jgi:hypothetical protein